MVVLAVILGILTGLAFNSSIFSIVLWVSFCPLFYLVEKYKKPAVIFYLAGLFHYFIVIYWLNFVTRLGFFLLVSYMALYWLLFSLFVSFFIQRKRSLLTIPLSFVVVELLREHLVAGTGWALFGFSQYDKGFLIQPIDLLGVKFISFLIITVNYFLYKVVKNRRAKKGEVLYVVGLIVFCLVYSYKVRSIEYEQRTIPVTVVQPNISQELKWEPNAKDYIIGKLINLTKETDRDSLVIYPEASWPDIVDRYEFFYLSEFLWRLDRDILIGALTEKDSSFYNSAVMFDNQGKYVQHYYKINLVPFGEFVPFRKYLTFIDVFNQMGDTTAGKKITTFKYRGRKFSVLICFEDVLTDFVSISAKGKDFLVNITNDGWFGGRPESIQHLAVMTIRAIENRISIVRAANTGISGYVDYLGNIFMAQKNGETDLVDLTAKFDLAVQENRSVYNKTGDAFSFFASIFVLLNVLLLRKKK